MFSSSKNGWLIQISVISPKPRPYIIPNKKCFILLFFLKFAFVIKKKIIGKIIKPNGNKKNGGSNKPLEIPHKKNNIKYFKLL